MPDFVEGRDLLRKHRVDYEAAYREFRWPDEEHFNWALDCFDAMACGNHRVALHVVDDAGSEEKLTFAELRERSDRVANFLRAAGVRRGDRILLMLGNVVPLWEITLAAIKLGAVFSPATAMLTTEDLQDRVDRGEIRHVIAEASAAAKFGEVKGNYTRIVAGGSRDGWVPFGRDGETVFKPDGRTRAGDPLLLYFTSGTTAKPKMVLHTHASYPVGHLSTMYWIGMQPGDVHLNISSPGWAKHAWSSFFAPWNAGAAIFVFNYARFDAKRILSGIGIFIFRSQLRVETVEVLGGILGPFGDHGAIWNGRGRLEVIQIGARLGRHASSPGSSSVCAMRSTVCTES